MTTAKRVAFGIVIALVVVGVEFFFIFHPLPLPLFIRVTLAYMNLIPIAVALRLAGGSASGPNLVVVGIVGLLQWFLIGFLATLPFGRHRPAKPSRGNEPP